MNPFIADSHTNPYSFPTNLEGDSPKLLEFTHLYGLQQGPNMMNMTESVQNTNIEIPELNTSRNNDGSALYRDNEHVVDSLDIIQPTTEATRQEEKTLDRDDITALERAQNPEWFIEGKPTKTPRKYMTVRNFILNYWDEHKPNYITKSSARKHMANCGDVTSFGRVHTFLESAGYINVNCVVPSQKTKRAPRKPRVPRPVSYVTKTDSQDYSMKKRKKKHNLEMWDTSELPRDSKTRRRREPPRYTDFSNEEVENDPYQLIPLETYTEDYCAPFQVNVESGALVIMDFHAHLVLTEIIGLLGGTFETNEDGEKKLTVKCVYPCKSISTDTQCEMDPVSEMQARECFEAKGLSVVGWYHSHPTFVAIPSIRDIENQMSYQELFQVKETGDEPFIGVIVNPYDTRDGLSSMAYVHISQQVNDTEAYRLPYMCDQTMATNNIDVVNTMASFEKLVEEYKDHQEKVDMSSRRNGQLAVDKCLASLERFVFLPPEARQDFFTDARRLIIDEFQLLHQD
ncbi:unnamed protein product [Absidia cylindrospora]